MEDDIVISISDAKKYLTPNDLEWLIMIQKVIEDDKVKELAVGKDLYGK